MGEEIDDKERGREREVNVCVYIMSVCIIPVNRPYLGGTVPLSLPLSHRPTFIPLLSHFLKSTSIR